MTARYQEIAADLRERIEVGEYPVGGRLPGYRDLAQTYQASKDVIRRAIAELESEGLVEAAQRRGIVVRPRTPRRRITRDTTVRRSRSGYVFPGASTPEEQWLPVIPPRRSMQPAPADIAELLGVASGEPVLRRRRVMAPAGEPPFDITDSWIHPQALADAPQAGEISTGPGGYLDRLEEAGHGPLAWTERVRARMPTAEEARLLAMPRSGMPVLELTRTGFSARTDHPVEVTVVLVPADRGEIITALRRDDTASWPVSSADPS
ncbi:GntR family transcriptional regulator [Actinocorallia aurantiaca]|uniref:HTH gntR-type domain-containing protein n=1 Tax=Actinocorallia aurantiaca TaxID=46204 RepID=A0ABN3UG70_9ACTN